MKVYDAKYVGMLDQASKAVTDAIYEESKALSVAMNVYFYTFMGALLCTILGIVLDHAIFKFTLPMGYFGACGVLNAAVSVLRRQAWSKRKEAEDKFFKVSKEISEYNSTKVLELMALQEIVAATHPDAHSELRIIN